MSTRLRASATSVVRLEIAERAVVKHCSGFLLTDEIALTAGHCLEDCSTDSCSIEVNVDLRFKYPQQLSVVGRSWGSYFKTKNLDAGWVRLCADPDVPLGSVGELNMEGAWLLGNDGMAAQNAFLIGHPGGHLQMLSQACQIYAASTSGYFHTCQGPEGSSGAPVWYEYRDAIAPLGLQIIRNPSDVESFRRSLLTNVQRPGERITHEAVSLGDVYRSFCETHTEDTALVDACLLINKIMTGRGILHALPPKP